MSALGASGATLGYGGRPVLEGLEFAIEPGTSVCVLGPNGGGKTTLFRGLTGDLEPLAGALHVDRRPAYVAQTDRTRLDFPVSALDVALMGSLAHGRWWLPARREDRRAASAALERVGLAEAAGTRFGALSGGQRQRVLIARALVQDAAVLLLDEPLAGVDPASAERIAALLEQLRAEGKALLVSTHDVGSAADFDLVLCLNRRQVAFGPPSSTLTRGALESTYESEIVVLENAEGELATVTVKHHEH